MSLKVKYLNLIRELKDFTAFRLFQKESVRYS